MKPSRTSFIEALESRIAPAGLVDVGYNEVTGVLTLTGDGANNEVTIFQTGANTYRIEGIATDIETGGNTFFDIGKLTSVTIDANGGADVFTISNLKTLTALTFNGGAGNDDLFVNEIVVKGTFNYNGGADSNTLRFDGLLTSISGDVTLTASAAATDLNEAVFDAEITTLGGRVLFTGGGGSDRLDFTGLGKVTISKGIDFSAGAGGSALAFSNTDRLTIGKLTTSESILFTGGAGNDELELLAPGMTLSGGIRMLGDALDDSISIESGSSFLTLGKLITGESILFDGAADEDALSISGAKITLAGGIDFNAAEGGSELSIAGLAGPVSIGKLSTGASVRLIGGAAGDELTITGPIVTLAGGVELNGLAGGNSLDLSAPGGRLTVGKLTNGASIDYTGSNGGDTIDLTAANLTLAGGVDFTPGDGTNRFQIHDGSGVAKLGKLSTGQSLLMNGGTGQDNVLFNPVKLTLAGGIEASLSGGNNTITFNNITGVATIGKLSGGASILYSGGANADKITANLLNLTLVGGVDVNGGDGANEFSTTADSGTLKIGALPTGRSIAWIGGANNEEINLLNHLVTLAGGVEITGGDGGNDFAAGSDSLVTIGKFGTGQSLVITGTGAAANEIDLGNITKLAGSIEVLGGTGVDDIDFGGRVTVGKNAEGLSISLTGNAGADGIDIADNTILAGGIFFDGGNDVDFLDLDAAINLTIGGGIQMNGGAGTDSITIVAPKLAMTGGLTFTGGADADSVSISADGFIGGDIQVDLGLTAAGTQSFSAAALRGLPGALQFRGALTVDADATNTTADSLTLRNVNITKIIDIELGGGVSTVAIDNLIAGDELKLSTGNGADVVNIEHENFFGISRIAKLATINMGDGDDHILIGNALPTVIAPFPDHTRVNFVGGLSLEGGNGANDDRNDILGQNTFGVPATINGVELNTLS